MRVLFDHQIFINQKVGGISRYIMDLKNGLEEYTDTDCRVAAHFSRNHYLSKEQYSFGTFIPKSIARFSNRNLIAEHYVNKADVIHPTYYNISYLRKIKKPVILTVHDLIYFKYPQLFPDFPVFQRHFEYALKRCDGIICISAATKTELERFYSLSGKQVKVIHHGIRLKYDHPVSATDDEGGYFLYVGGRHHYKKFEVLLKAFKKLIKKNKNAKLIVVGGEPLSQEEKSFFDQYHMNITHEAFVTDDTLLSMFRNAMALIVTSLDEGFCYPVVEAVFAGTKVICSDIEVLREIAGTFASFYDVGSADSLYELMESYMKSDRPQKQMLADNIRQHYSIERMCNDTRLFYNIFA